MTQPHAPDLLAALQRYCEAHALPWDDARASRFLRYVELLSEFNQKMNLIGPMSPDEIVSSLILDSVAAAAAVPMTGTMVDVGTGAGLPGVPLKILLPDLDVTLVEPRKKRAMFLRIAAQRLGLGDGLTVCQERIEAHDPRARYDVVISKAFEPPPKWLRTAHGLANPHAAIVCMTRRRALDELAPIAHELGLHVEGTSEPRLGAPGHDPDDRLVIAWRVESNT